MKVDYIKDIRRLVGKRRLLIPTAGCVVIDHEGKILLQQRSDGGTWGCPGGLMDLDETVLECVYREILEETGLTVDNLGLLGIYSGRRYYATYPNGDETAPTQIVFITKSFSGELRHDEESIDLRFFSFEELPHPLNSKWSECIRHAHEYLKGERKIPVIL